MSHQGSRRQGQRRIVRMRDIADAAGVSQSTVSRILSGEATVVPVAPETRERVLAISDEMRYRPNPLARGLRGAQTMLLGVIVRDITDPFFAGAIDAISREALGRGYNVVLGNVHGKGDEAIALRVVLETRHCDAILLLGDTSDQPSVTAELLESQVPVVALWQGGALPGIPTVNVDNAAGIEAALDHLVALGHRQIAFISGQSLGDTERRRDAYQTYLLRHGIVVPAEYVRQAANHPGAAADAFTALMQAEPRPTAVVASTDVQAVGALHAAYRLGLRVPQDVSVVGFDDIPIAAYTVPALTTVAMPMAVMASTAVEVAIGRRGRPGRSEASN